MSGLRIESKRINLAARNTWSGVLFGIGCIAFIDEAVFHQLLHWHHFYDRSTTQIGLVSDGIFHAFSWAATVAALFMLADLRRRKALSIKRWLGGGLIGAGAFQAYDGAIQHKIMRLHQIRYVEHLFWYDMIWLLTAIAMGIGGIYLVTRAKRVPSRDAIKEMQP